MPNVLAMPPVQVPSISRAASNALAMRATQENIRGTQNRNLLAEKQLAGYDAAQETAAQQQGYQNEARAISTALQAGSTEQANQIYKRLGGKSDMGISIIGNDVSIDYGVSIIKGPPGSVAEFMERVSVDPTLMTDPAKAAKTRALMAENGISLEKREVEETPEQILERKKEFEQFKADLDKDKQADTSYAPDPLTKLFNEMDSLPEGSPRKVAYQRRIDKLTLDSNPSVELVLAQRIVDGKLDFNKLSRRGGQKGRIAAVIAEIAPDFSLIDAEANIKYKTDASNLRTIALIAGINPLFKNLSGKAKELENGIIPIFNKGVNFYKLQTGEEKIVAFNNLRDDIIAEVERVMMGSSVLSDSKYNRALHNLNSAQSPKQMGAAIQQMMMVVEKREEALKSEPYPQKRKGEPAVTATNPVTGEQIFLRDGKWESE